MSGIEIGAMLSSIGSFASSALPYVGTAMGVMGAFSEAGGQASSAQSARAMGQYNQAVALQEADAATDAATFEADKQREKTRRLLSTQRARYAASGVTFEGSPLLVMEQTAADAELDARAIEYGGELKARSARSRAAMNLYEGETAYESGMTRVGTSLLTTASRAFMDWGGSGAEVKIEGQRAGQVTRYNQLMRVK